MFHFLIEFISSSSGKGEFYKKSDQDHLSSVDPVYACVVGNQKVGDQVPVGCVVVHLFSI